MQIDSEKIEKSRKTLSSFFFTIFGLEVLNGYVIFSFIVLGLMMGPYMPFSKMRDLV
jgi:hypothetical protein